MVTAVVMPLFQSPSLPCVRDLINSSAGSVKKDADRLHYKYKVPSQNLWKEDKVALLDMPQYLFSVFQYTTPTVSKVGFGLIETNKYGLSPILVGENVQSKVFYEHVEFYHDHRPVEHFLWNYKTSDEVYDWMQHMST